jgi:hypothetical protein
MLNRDGEPAAERTASPAPDHPPTSQEQDRDGGERVHQLIKWVSFLDEYRAGPRSGRVARPAGARWRRLFGWGGVCSRAGPCSVCWLRARWVPVEV